MNFSAYFKKASLHWWILALLLITTVIFHWSVQVNYNQNHLKRYNVDEFYTVYQAYNSIGTGTIENYRALEGSRWIVRAFYPGALIGMSKKMGGNVKNDSWGYPGHNYVKKHYKNSAYRASSKLHPNMNDPNIRDFFFYLRLQNVILCLISVILLVIYSWKSGSWLSAFLLSIALGLNYYLIFERSLFYIEASFFAFLNLFILFYLFLLQNGKTSYFLVLVAGLISAFMISIKFSCVFFVLLLFLTIIYLERRSGTESLLKKILLFVLSFIISFKAINFYAFQNEETLGIAIHQFFSNFWKYSTGSDLNQDYGSYFIGMLDVFKASLGYLVYLLPIIFIFGFLLQSKNDRLKYGAIVVCLIVTLITLLDQKKFIARNFVPFLGIIVLLTGVYCQVVVKYLNDRYKKFRLNLVIYPFLGLLVLIGIINERNSFSNFKKQLFPNSRDNISSSLSEIKNIKNRTLVYIDCSADNFNGFEEGKSTTMESYPVVGNENFKQVKDSLVEKFKHNDIVIVNRISNNKQYTNYLLPKIYSSNEQFGQYFIFYNDNFKRVNRRKAADRIPK